MQDSVKIECTKCGRKVNLNGIGSSRSPLQRFITGAVGVILPFTCKKFRPASDWHDEEVHRGPMVGKKDFEVWYKAVDNRFYEMCLELAEDSNWFGKMYYKKQARELYEALKFNDGNGYPMLPCNQRVL